MKRIVSLLLAAILLLAPCVQGFATDTVPGTPAADQTADLNDSAAKEGDTSDGGPAGDELGDGTEGSGETEEDETGPAEDPQGTPDDISLASEGESNLKDEKSQIDVRIIQALDFKSEIKFNITLKSPNGDSVSKPIELGGLTSGAGSEKLQNEVTFNGDGSGLESGVYRLSISAPGYRTRYRDITVKDGEAYKLTYLTGFVDYYYEENEAGVLQAKDPNCHPGVLRIGDVNGDGQIDDKDKKQLVDQIDDIAQDGESAEVNKETAEDLNRDGKIDIADLNFFVQGYFEGKVPDAMATIQMNIPASAVEKKAGDGTGVEGNLDDLLTGEGSVALKPADGVISSSNPVTVDFFNF